MTIKEQFEQFIKEHVPGEKEANMYLNLCVYLQDKGYAVVKEELERWREMGILFDEENFKERVEEAIRLIKIFRQENPHLS